MMPAVKAVIGVEVNSQCQMKSMQVLRVARPGHGCVAIYCIADRRSTGGNGSVYRTGGSMDHSGRCQSYSGVF